MSRWLLFLSVALATCGLATGYAWDGWLIGGGLVLLVGLFWLLGLWRGWAWPSSPMLALFVLAAAIGLEMELGAGWMLLGVVAALAGWDLDHFGRRLQDVDDRERRDLEQRHMLRLLGVVGTGLLLAAVGMWVRTRLGFGLTLLLGLLLVLGLGQVVGYVRRHGD